MKSLEFGNKIAKASIRILNLLLELRIPAILENPRSSRMWHLPQLVRIIQSRLAHFITSDLCQFGTRWRKRTGLLCINLDSALCYKELNKRCRGSSVKCSSTNKAHLLLSGSSPSGVPWTHLAQVHPKRSAASLAKVLALGHNSS